MMNPFKSEKPIWGSRIWTLNGKWKTLLCEDQNCALCRVQTTGVVLRKSSNFLWELWMREDVQGAGGGSLSTLASHQPKPAQDVREELNLNRIPCVKAKHISKIRHKHSDPPILPLVLLILEWNNIPLQWAL